MRNRAIIRIRIITALILSLAVVLIVRLYFIQIAHGERYAEQADGQYVHTAQNIFNRGSIYFTTRDNNHLSAATVQTGFILAVNPSRIQDAGQVYAQLEQYLTVDEELFVRRSTLPNRTYVEIEPAVLRQDAESIRQLQIPGVMLYGNQWRHYPGNDLSASTIGFVARGDSNDLLQGRYGLERYYEEVLTRDTESLSVNVFAEIFTQLGNLVVRNIDYEKGDVVTTIEPIIARRLEQTLLDTHEQYGSVLTGGIIMDPNTGAIVAMGTVPSFDLNNRSGVPIQQFRNSSVEDVYEFGSIVKALTIAAGIDAQVITPSSTYYDTGSITLDQFTIRNFDGRGRGEVDMQAVLSQSLNTGVSYIVEQMGTSRFRDYFFSFGLNERSGIDLPSESRGLTENLHSPRRVEYATASFGQGIAVTPVAMIRSLAVLANGGYLVTPHIGASITHLDGRSTSIVPERGPQVLSTDSSEKISRMLTRVVDEALRGGGVALPNHTVGAKTGTAQIPNPTTGGYYEDRFLHSFFGYFPAYEPEFIILLYTVDPKGKQYASETLTEPFMDMTSYLINYYQIPPDR